MKLSDEYQAAVNLGYISQTAAEREYAKSVDYKIDAEDDLQRKAFTAGYLWLFFLYKWEVSDKDMAQAKDAWAKWCAHLETL